MMATLCAPADPTRDTKAYALYCSMLREHREACLIQMINVLKPSNHIYQSMNAILTWMATDLRQAGIPLQHVTTDPMDVAPRTWPLDGFANYMIRMGLALKNDLFLASHGGRWILAHHAAHDCHATVKVGMHPSALVHGPPEGGKSHLFNSALTDVAIPDTVTSLLETSDKAWYVHDDSVGLIIRVVRLGDAHWDPARSPMSSSSSLGRGPQHMGRWQGGAEGYIGGRAEDQIHDHRTRGNVSSAGSRGGSQRTIRETRRDH